MGRFDGDMEGALSTISQIWLGLQWLLWTRPSDSAPLDRTVDFLRRTQHVGGYWDEPPGILEFNPPSWRVPGNHANQLWLTSAVCCKLLELGRQADARFAAALEFLRSGWEEDGFPVFLHTHWMGLYIFRCLDEQTDLDREIARGCASRLIGDLSKDAVDGTDATAIAHAAFRSGANAVFDMAFPMFVRNQVADGGWITAYGDEHRPQSMIEAMHLAAQGL